MWKKRALALVSLWLAASGPASAEKVLKGRIRVVPDKGESVRVTLAFTASAAETQEIRLKTEDRRPYRFDLLIPPSLESRDLTVHVKVDSPEGYAAYLPMTRMTAHESLSASFLRPIVLLPAPKVCRQRIRDAWTLSPSSAIEQLRLCEHLDGALSPDLRFELRIAIATNYGREQQWEKQQDELAEAFADVSTGTVDAGAAREYFKLRLEGFDRMTPGSRRTFGEQVLASSDLLDRWSSLVNDFAQKYPNCIAKASIPLPEGDPKMEEISLQRAGVARLIGRPGLSVNDCS